MIEILSSLSPKDMFSIDSQAVYAFTGQEDFRVESVELYEDEECQIVFVETNAEVFLVAHNLSGENRYFIYEEHEVVETDEDELPSEIYLSNHNGAAAYYDTGNTLQTEDEIMFCEYECSSKKFSHVLALQDSAFKMKLLFNP